MKKKFKITEEQARRIMYLQEQWTGRGCEGTPVPANDPNCVKCFSNQVNPGSLFDENVTGPNCECCESADDNNSGQSPTTDPCAEFLANPTMGGPCCVKCSTGSVTLPSDPCYILTNGCDCCPEEPTGDERGCLDPSAANYMTCCPQTNYPGCVPTIQYDDCCIPDNVGDDPCPNGIVSPGTPNWGLCQECQGMQPAPSPWPNITGLNCECCKDDSDHPTGPCPNGQIQMGLNPPHQYDSECKECIGGGYTNPMNPSPFANTGVNCECCIPPQINPPVGPPEHKCCCDWNKQLNACNPGSQVSITPANMAANGMAYDCKELGKIEIDCKTSQPIGTATPPTQGTLQQKKVVTGKKKPKPSRRAMAGPPSGGGNPPPQYPEMPGAMAGPPSGGGNPPPQYPERPVGLSESKKLIEEINRIKKLLK